MNIIIYAKNLEVPAAFIKQTEQKFKKIAKLSRQIISIKVDLSHDTHHRKGQVYRVESNLTVPDKMFRVVEYDFDLSTCVNKVKDIMARQLAEYKDKRRGKIRSIRKINTNDNVGFK